MRLRKINLHVMPALVAGISLRCARIIEMATELGLARVLNILMPKSGRPDLGDKPGHDKFYYFFPPICVSVPESSRAIFS
jgi:hypothetical protein